MLRQIVFAFFFLTAALGGQERPQFMKTVLTKDGPVTQQYWADELLAKLSPSATQRKSAVRYASSLRPLATATAPSGFERFGVIPYGGTVEGLQAFQATVAADPSYEWVSFSPVFRGYQTTTTTTTTDSLRWAQWQLSDGFPGNIGWGSAAVKTDHVYVVFADTGGCFGHEDFDWSRNFWNYNALDSSKSPVDDQGHGCAVASIVAAKTNNGLGIAGIAPFVKYGFIKVLDKKGESDASTVVDGLLATAAIANALKQQEPHARVVLNLSFGAMDYIEPVAEAIRVLKAAGVIVVAAAGNSGLNIDRIKFTPASLPEVIAVGASDWENAVAARGWWASNWGPKSVLLAAPGMDVMAAVPKGTATDQELFDPSGYRRVDGTSFSAPHVVGAIALMLAQHPDLSESQIRIRLMNANRDMKPWKLNLRDYQSEELFTAAGSLRLDTGALADDNALPAQPYIKAVAVGHSSARLVLAGTGDDGVNGKPFGSRCFYSTRQFTNNPIEPGIEEVTFLPFLDSYTQADEIQVLLRGKERQPLQQDTAYHVACQVVDKVGNWSAPSELATFQTVASQSLFSGLEGFTAEPGPISEFVAKFNGGNLILWHQTSINGGTTVWYAGNGELNYRGQASDSELVSPEIDLRSVTGSISLRLQQFLQMFGLLMQGTSYDEAEVRVEDLDASPVTAKIVAENLPNNSSFSLEERAFDLSEFAGKRIRLRFRFFTNGSSSVGIGWIIGQVQIRTDAR
jgi:subtilisin family serine protease